MNHQRFLSWTTTGLEAILAGPAVCYTHDGVPTSEHEDDTAGENGEYECIPILRLFESSEVTEAPAERGLNRETRGHSDVVETFPNR